MKKFEHVSVFLNKAIEALNINPSGTYVDCTFGGGGHTSEILKQITDGHVYAFDQDLDAINNGKNRFNDEANLTLIHNNFALLKESLEDLDVKGVDGILFDLGVSSYQFDEASRGFSYRFDAKLDMRMDQSKSITAEHLVNGYTLDQLTHIFRAYSDEPFAYPIAKKILIARDKKPIETTFELVDIIKSALPAKVLKQKGHPAKRVFQSLRIEVNQEFEVLEQALKQSKETVNIGGRIVVITFHSTEDRIVKQYFKSLAELPTAFAKLPVIPESEMPKFKHVNVGYKVSKDEIEENNRSHSARIRVVERVR